MTLLETTITTLEMRRPPCAAPSVATGSRLEAVQAESLALEVYRHLYEAVGKAYHWVDRRRMSDTDLASILGDPLVEVHLLRVDGRLAGFFELDRREPGTIALAYFGLFREFHGRGLGGASLSAALRAAWAWNPERVRVETCTLDHPAALPLYLRAGFREVARRLAWVDTIEESAARPRSGP